MIAQYYVIIFYLWCDWYSVGIHKLGEYNITYNISAQLRQLKWLLKERKKVSYLMSVNLIYRVFNPIHAAPFWLSPQCPKLLLR